MGLIIHEQSFLFGNATTESPHTEVCASKVCSTPLRCFPSLLQKWGFRVSIYPLPRVFRHALWEWPSNFTHKWGLTILEEMPNFRCCLGCGPSIGFHLDLCTKMYINGLGSESNLMFITWRMHCILLFILKITPLSSMWKWELKKIL